MAQPLVSQPSLLDVPVPKKHKPVRQTSRAVYAIGLERFTGRKGAVLRHLAAHWNAKQISPTSAELAHWLRTRGVEEVRGKDFTWIVLWVRRGLSDLEGTGIVHGSESRSCGVTNQVCLTWRVVQR